MRSDTSDDVTLYTINAGLMFNSDGFNSRSFQESDYSFSYHPEMNDCLTGRAENIIKILVKYFHVSIHITKCGK